MSDYGYAADSPYDAGDDDYYWDDAASQDLADDLAEHTMPSPVYLEDPAWEMMGGHSDWEYYSDDYYDDDPKLLRGNPQAGSPPASLSVRKVQTSSRKAQTHGRKRKLADTEENPSLSLGGSDPVVIVQNIGQDHIGITWRINKPSSEELYHQGEAAQVALLKDWRSIFRESQPKSDRRSKGLSSKTLALHEEWANDLSLADMGLMTAIGKHVSTNDVDNGYNEDEDEDLATALDGYSEDGLSETEERAVFVNAEANNSAGSLGDEMEDGNSAVSTTINSQAPAQLLPSRERKSLEKEEAVMDGPDARDKSEIKSDPGTRTLPVAKRRKIGLDTSTSARPSRKSNTTDPTPALEIQTNKTQKRTSSRPRREAIQHGESKLTQSLEAKNAIAKPVVPSTSTNNKRKAVTEEAVSNDDGEAITKASSRAKRVASTNRNIRSDNGSQPETSLAEPTTRRTRTRKE